MEENKKKKLQENKGITLIALIVTIVVLIILAGISIGAISGENGLISKSKKARDEAEKMQNSTAQNREELYGEISGKKDSYKESGEVGVILELERLSDTSIKATAEATDTKNDIVSYEFYIKKVTENNSAYVRIKKDDKLKNEAICSNLETDMAYKVKVVAMNKEGVSKTAEKKIALGNVVKISVTPMSAPDSYPSTSLVTATSVMSNMDYILLPSGEKVYAQNGKFKMKTTYNSTKNGPIIFTAYDKEGNSGLVEYDEQNVINFETEWTFAEANTEITVPVTGYTVDVYIDYGDGTKENVTTVSPTHIYETPGVYTMKISGKCDSFGYNPSIQNYLTGLRKWGCLSNSSYLFRGYANITGTIPSPHKQSFQNVTSFWFTFDGCSGLTGSIPTGLFANCQNVKSFPYTFSGCRGLTGNIPVGIFDNCQNVTDFSKTFANCHSLTGSIPENLFTNCPNVTNFFGTFDSCRNLTGSIPAGLFDNCSNVKAFDWMFFSCGNLTGSIPENLFAKCPDVTNFGNTFNNCKNLTGNIPENLFANCPNVTSFEGTFGGCGLTGSIPAGLFDNCPDVTNFGNTFYNCYKLTGNIPENLFANCPNVTSFRSTFNNCKNLTGNIPENLFANCSNVTSFEKTFQLCLKLEENIPENLFANCPDVTNFLGTFYYCSNLTGSIPENLFVNCRNVTIFGDSIRTENNNNGGNGTFANCTSLSGKAPELWKRTNVENSYYCFWGCTNLENYAEIPADWK